MITVCGPKVTRDDVWNVEPMRPDNAGKRWAPVRHGDLVDIIEDEVTMRGWGINQELFTLGKDGGEMAGALMFNRVSGVNNLPGMAFAIGFINSNIRRKALRITVGASVACCLNGMCTGTILLNRVHDHTVDLMNEIEDALDRYAAAAADIPNVVRRLRERELAPGEASEVLMEVGRRNILGWAAIGRVDREYRRPTFAEHGTGTSWALLNAFTYTARNHIAPVRQMEAYNTFREMLPLAA